MALASDLRPRGWMQVRLLDRTWALRRDADAVVTARAALGAGALTG